MYRYPMAAVDTGCEQDPFKANNATFNKHHHRTPSGSRKASTDFWECSHNEMTSKNVPPTYTDVGLKASKDVIYRNERSADLLQLINDKVVEEIDRHATPHRDVQIHIEWDQFERFLSQKESLELRDDVGQTVLHLAVMYCTPRLVNRLLEAGCNPGTPDDRGLTPVHYCALYGSLEVFKLLPTGLWEVKDAESGKYPIHYAALSGNVEIVEYILQLGGAIDCQDHFGHTPVVIAALFEQPECCEFLIENGCKSEITDIVGMPAVVIINAKYHTLGNMILDRYIQHDYYQGAMKVDLGFLLAKTDTQPFENVCRDDKDIESIVNSIQNHSPYEIMVALSKDNTAHPMVKAVTDLKWDTFGRHYFYTEFGGLLAFGIFWALFFIFPSEKYDFSGDKVLAVCLGIVSFIVILLSVVAIIYKGKRARDWGMTLRRMMKARVTFESRYANHLTRDMFEKRLAVYHQYRKSHMLIGPAYVLGFVGQACMHLVLLASAMIKTINFYNSVTTTDSTLEKAVEIIQSVILMAIWLRIFWHLKVHAEIGKFVIFTKELFRDIGMVAGVFIFLYIPNLTIFYNSFYKYSTTDSSWSTINNIPFTVMRMALVDYDYDTYHDVAAKRGMGGWWNIWILIWMMISAVVILNLFIALMSDRYALLGDTADAILALKRAEFMASCELFMPKKKIEKINDELLKDHRMATIPCTEKEPDNKVEKDVKTLNEKVDRLTELLERMNQAQTSNNMIVIED